MNNNIVKVLPCKIPVEMEAFLKKLNAPLQWWTSLTLILSQLQKQVLTRTDMLSRLEFYLDNSSRVETDETVLAIILDLLHDAQLVFKQTTESWTIDASQTWQEIFMNMPKVSKLCQLLSLN